ADIPTPPTDGEDGLWIVKSVWEHASIGLDDAALVPARDVAAALARRRGRWGGDWFAERYIDGREFNLALLAGPHGPEVLPAAEIVFQDFPPDMPRIVGYAAKWDADSFACRHTVRTFPGDADRPLLAAMQELALRCWRLFGLAGYARVDFRVDGAGRPWVLEVNANPCLSPDAGFMASANRAGYGFDDVVRRLVEDARGFSA
ncbi:MAG: D-alanine--D-alanine ligase, partial [Pseudomonadota bacterium]|nr:D-alanine--D-alanine ligase [Pseudomonadota bacterium]